jgi:hypothetical protein
MIACVYQWNASSLRRRLTFGGFAVDPALRGASAKTLRYINVAVESKPPATAAVRDLPARVS